jgi:CRP-like cAMP-binding protein
MDRHLSFPMFEDCGRRERTVISRLGTTVTIEPGQRLSTEGARGRQFAVVLDGELVVTRGGTRVATLSEGDCVGEIALLDGRNAKATATVEALVASTVWALSPAEFDELVDAVPRVAARLNHLGLTRAAHNAAT